MIVDGPSARVVHRFRHALMMVSELIPHTDAPDLPEPVRVACLEDWFTNYRMLVEFLILKPPKNCAGVQDLLPGWKPETTQELQRLRADYGFASEHVSHIGLPKPTELTQNVAPSILHIKAVFLLDVVDELAKALSDAEHPFAESIQLAARQAREGLSAAGVGPTS